MSEKICCFLILLCREKKIGYNGLQNGDRVEVCMVLCLYVAILSFFLSAYMFLPFFALYVKELGGSYAEFAVVLSVTGFMISII